ncbi:hypothetical protein IFM89_007049 [Coptis chinensis]|uniref:ABC1 atypical kinase-like domain-containing protein n=1 Tax=Coptis chinensis TaxID=261450 RepID=A0A835HIN1_9MAGN|nr:hypothetical protein IFM89_007049 [Coptis chinensis]
MSLLDRRYNILAQYEDFVTIREPSKYYAIIPDTQMLVYMESLYATVGETLSDRSLTIEEKISVLSSNMSWSLRLSFKELLEENTRIPYVTKSKGLMMAFDLSNHLWILVVFCFRTWTCLIYDLLEDVIADPTPRLEKICTLLLYALLMHNKDCDKIPPFLTHIAIKSIESQLGVLVSQIFADISPEPVAAASLGQVAAISESAEEPVSGLETSFV